MAWMMDTCSVTQGKTIFGVVTGKPILLRGSVGRRDATGRGVVYTLDQTMRHLGRDLRGQRVVVQGFGNVEQPCDILIPPGRRSTDPG
jgi:glutamate dehydrogenase (NAD(P)+)